ncbi:MAG: ribosome biogenesis GTPase Der [Nitrospinae bacterium]|nr:ribosome biogenesis GTPase Der [Nitrospinota bacterium]
MSIPLVAIIGRANVGKSTLFNKIARKRSAIVNDTPGVTRDRIYARAEWRGKAFMVIDTGGIDVDEDTEIELKVKEQARLAISEAEAIVFLADSRQGVTPQDKEVFDKIRKSRKPFFLAVNKVDHPGQDWRVHEFSELGAEKIYPISAEHGIGIEALVEDVADCLPEPAERDDAAVGIKIAVMGKPNAGKSSLVNSLLKTERCIVSDIPGTTRDAVDSALVFKGKSYVLVDTAGIRRKGKTRLLLDKYSVIMALKAMERCDIAVLLLDAEAGVTDQDATIAGYAFEKGRGCVIVLNKWDLVENKKEAFARFMDTIKEKLKFLDFAPVLTVSAKTGMGLDRFLPTVEKVYAEYSKELPTAKLNSCFEAAIKKNPMSGYRGKFLKLFYSTQVKKCPPTFRCFVNYPEGIHFSYQRYLTNSLRKAFGFSGTPVRLIFSQRQTRP